MVESAARRGHEVDQSTEQRARDMAGRDDFPIKGFSHLEWWVGNAYQTSMFLGSVLGFSITGYRGPETGTPDTQAKRGNL